jgi:hypothetical protein
MVLEAIRNVALGIHQQIARQTDNPLIRPATGRGRQFVGGGISDVNADHGEIAVVELPDVRATLAGGGLRSVFVRVGANAFFKHGKHITTVKYFVNQFSRNSLPCHQVSNNALFVRRS